MDNSYRYFENHACKYYPCHEGMENMNCLFCYCPLNHIVHCPGNPKFVEVNGKQTTIGNSKDIIYDDLVNLDEDSSIASIV